MIFYPHKRVLFFAKYNINAKYYHFPRIFIWIFEKVYIFAKITNH